MNVPLPTSPWLIYEKLDIKLGEGSYGQTFLAKKKDPSIDSLFCVKEIPIRGQIALKYVLLDIYIFCSLPCLALGNFRSVLYFTTLIRRMLSNLKLPILMTENCI